MKFVLIFALLAYAKFSLGNSTGPDQNVCATPCNPINISVHGKEGVKGEKGEKGDSGTSCECILQDLNKPSAHLEGADKKVVTYQANTEIKDWSVSAPSSHLAGGMKYHDGKLTVPISGRYYIYAQIYFNNNGRTMIRVNSKVITIIQPPITQADKGTLYTGGVFYLKAGDVISLSLHTYPVSSIKIYMYNRHTYFGAFLI
ncbi:hypothetical protein ACROYT_G039744 [Oculina patagonica]